MSIVKAMTPAIVAPVAPIAPIAPLHAEGHNAIGMAKDIEYLRGTVDNIEKKLDRLTETHVAVTDFGVHTKASDLIHTDHETRLRSVETSTTRILVWGSVILTLMTVAQFALQFYRY